MTTASYIQLELSVSPDLTDLLTALLAQLGFEGFWEDGPTLRCYMSEGRWSDELAREIEATIRLLLPTGTHALPAIHIERIVDQNWNEQWERSIQPIYLTPEVLVAPTWQPCTVEPGTLLLRIDPKMAFGTGYHESTRLAAALLRAYIKPSTRVLDLGTGTGILGILAVKSGASHVTAVDIDEWSFQNARENALLNNSSDCMEILQGGLEVVPPGRFDMIVANIQLTVIAGLLGELRDRLEPEGVLIVSGLLARESVEVAGLLQESDLVGLEERCENDWIAVAAAHPTS